MLTITMMAVLSAAAGLLLDGRFAAPDPERLAGRAWGWAAGDAFFDCPRSQGFAFWLGCTDRAPPPRRRP